MKMYDNVKQKYDKRVKIDQDKENEKKSELLNKL